MKTKIFLSITILLVGFTLQAQSKVGTVDSEYIISKMPQVIKVQERIAAYGKKLDSTFQSKVKAYDVKVTAYNNDVKTLTEAVKKTRYNELAKMDQDMKKFRQNGVKLMQLRRDDYMRPLYKKLADVIAEVAKKNGYTQILTVTGNQFAYFDEKLDITKLVFAKLGIKE